MREEPLSRIRLLPAVWRPVSRHRVRPDRGFVDLKLYPKGPNGRGLCRWCGKEVPPGKKTFCNDDCVHEWKIRTQPAYARKLVFQRDKGRCALCGETKFGGRQANYRGVVLSYKSPRPIWCMDHHRPVVEGGGECGLDNLRTLCVECHKGETAKLAARRAEARRLENPGSQ